MSFLDKYAFPNQAVYNTKSQGGSKCTGAIIVELNKPSEDCKEVEDAIELVTQ